MKAIVRIILTLSVLLLPSVTARSAALASEDLNYVITYKWGLIHKEAGTATLSLRPTADSYRLTLTARTKPWADKIFNVRDTLTSVVSRSGLKPQKYIKSAHEGGKFSRDEITFTHSGSQVNATTRSLRIDKKGERRESQKQLSATGPTFDMLSVFYFLRTINYDGLAKGETVKANIFSGKMKESVTIRSVGKETIQLRDKAKTKREAWHIKFRFTSNGGKKSSDDIDAWISADSAHIPLQIIGSLPIGQVRVYLIGQ